MPKTIALVLRGHIRDAFSDDRLRSFVLALTNDPRLCVHLYMQTWDVHEAASHCSWRGLDDGPRHEVTLDVLSASLPFPARRVRILREEDAHLVGDVDGAIGGTSKNGWKRMWYGLFTIMNDIRNGDATYDQVVSLRFDFFGAYVSGRHVDDFGRVITPHDVVEWIATTDAPTITFLSNHACTGIDNCYMGPTRWMFTLCACFHFNLDQTCADVGGEYNQEKMVYKLAQRLVTT